MLLNIIGGMLICACLAVMSPNTMVATVFMREQLGASRTVVGLNFALWMAGVTLCLPGGWLFNSLRSRRPTWLVLMVTGRAFLFVVAAAAIISHHREWRHELAIVVLAANVACVSLTSLTSPGWWAWMADLIPESIRGHFFGRRYQMLLLSTAVSMVIAGLVLDRVPAPKSLLFFGIFLVAATLSIIDPILFWWVPEPARPTRPRTTFGEAISLYARPLKDKAFLTLTISAALQTLLYNMPLTFYVLYQRGETIGGQYVGCGASLQFLAFMYVLQQVSLAVVAALWGHLADRIGHRTVFILGNLSNFASVLFFVMGPGNYHWLLPLYLIVSSVMFAGSPVAQQNLMIGIAPQSEREYYVSTFWAVVCGAGAIGPWLGGVLADAVPITSIRLPHGQPLSYLHLQLILVYVGTLLNIPLAMRIPDIRAQALLPWFARMISGVLFRTAWNISAIDGAASPLRRVRALRNVGPSDGNVVLGDVSSALEDPDPGVRREALLALGRIGTPEAVELLMWYLHEPDRPTRMAAAEALGTTRSSDGTLPLLTALRNDDVNVRRAAADALANIADDRTADTLLDLLDTEQDAEVLVSAASGLSRLREFRALGRMVEMALHNPSRIVRAHITVALGDLLGRPGQFYRLWRRERRLPGSGSVEVARQLRRRTRSLHRLARMSNPSPHEHARALVLDIRNDLDVFVECIQAEEYGDAMSALRHVSLQFLRLRYDYRGDAEQALQFIMANDPSLTEFHWLIDHLAQTCRAGTAPEAYWDGLTLLAAWAIIQGWRTT
jgi:MFS family permease